MRSSDSRLAHGTSGSPQLSSEQFEYESIALENEQRLAESGFIDDNLVEEPKEKKAKFSRDEMRFIARDATGQIVWLEEGNASAGLEHILHGNDERPGHAADFMRAFNVAEGDVPEFLYRVVTLGTVVQNKLKPISGKHMGYERVYKYNGQHYVVTGIGTNGFIVSAYPSDKYKE